MKTKAIIVKPNDEVCANCHKRFEVGDSVVMSWCLDQVIMVYHRVGC